MTIAEVSEASVKNATGTNTRGFFDRRNMASPGDHKTLKSKPILCICAPVDFLHFFVLAFKSMRKLLLLVPFVLFAVPALAQDVDIAVRPDLVYIESIAGNIVPM